MHRCLNCYYSLWSDKSWNLFLHFCIYFNQYLQSFFLNASNSCYSHENYNVCFVAGTAFHFKLVYGLVLQFQLHSLSSKCKQIKNGNTYFSFNSWWSCHMEALILWHTFTSRVNGLIRIICLVGISLHLCTDTYKFKYILYLTNIVINTLSLH